MVWRIGLRHGDEILCGRITITGKVDAGTCCRTDVKVGGEGKIRRRIWISTRSNQGISHFINVVFKRRRTTAKHVVYLLQRPSDVNQVCCCHWSWDMEEHCPTERTMFWLFKDKSHHIFYVEQRLTMSMRTQNSRLRRMEKKLSLWESGCTADWPIPFSQAWICSHI